MQFSPEVWVFRVNGTEVGSAGIQEAQLQDIQEYFGSELAGSLAIPRWQYQWLSSGDAEAQLYFELLFYTSQLVHKGLNIDWDSHGIR